jgi:alkylation response protein AidB-like acyl-CoA dehydrogenase
MRSRVHDTAGGGRFLSESIGQADVFTPEDLTGEQRLFARTAAEFMQKEVLPVVERLYDHDWVLTRQLIKKAAGIDLLSLEIPIADGGLGLDLISASFVGEQLAVDPSFGGSIGAHTSIGTLPLVYFGNDDQRARYLPRLASGDLIAAYALTEPQAGSDALAARTTATLTPDGRHYLLNGQKIWITNGGFADLFTIFAKVDGLFTAFLVERSMGVVSGPDEIKLGLDGSSTTSLTLDNVKVPVENVLGTIGEGHRVALNVLNVGRVKLGSRNMSGVKLALGHAVRYANVRRQFGQPIARFGLIQEKLAGMAIRGFIGDALSYRTLGDVDRALGSIPGSDRALVLKTIEGFAVECSINKVWTSEALAWVVDQAVQVFGGNGYSRAFPVERMYRDARITRIYEGTNEINRMLISCRLLRQSPELFSTHAVRHALEDRIVPAHGAFATEHDALERAKRLAIALLGEASASYAGQWKQAQEIQGRIADLIIEVYACESGLARAEKLTADDRAGLAADIARVYTEDATGAIVQTARQIVAALTARKVEASAVAKLAGPLVTRPGFDAIAARRRIADAVIQAERYPF